MKPLLILTFFVVLSLSCAAGPTPERVGFDYPLVGIKFSPRRDVVSRTTQGMENPRNPDAYRIIMPRTIAEVEGRYKRILFTGVGGEIRLNSKPLFDDVSTNYYGIREDYTFALIEEKEIDLPWIGLESKRGTLRVFSMTPISDEGKFQYTFAVTVFHRGNTFEICWREVFTTPPDQEKIDMFFYWTKGLKFYEPKTP